MLSGISALADGKIIVTGGDDDQRTSIYDPNLNPGTGTWIPGKDMVKPRGYQVRVTGALTYTPPASCAVWEGSYWSRGCTTSRAPGDAAQMDVI